MDMNHKTTDEALDQSDIIHNNTYNSMVSNLPKENFKEFDVYIDWETGTKHTMGIDDNQMPHLLSSEEVNLLDKGKKGLELSGEAKVMASEATIEANQALWKGAKQFFVRAPTDYWNSIKRAALKMNDASIQAADFLTAGNYSLFAKSVTGETYYRNDDLDMTLKMKGEVLADGSFENSATDTNYMNGGQFSAFDINGKLKEGWKEITLPMARLQDSEFDYEGEGFGMPLLMEYGVQYGVPGVQMYKLLGKVPYLNTWGRVILAELGTEFTGATQDEEDINMANMIVSFGYNEEFDKKHNVDNSAQIILRELLDAVAADIDDSAFERKVKNAIGNAPIGVGFAGVLQAFKFMKAFKNNKEGRKIVSEELGLQYKGDEGEEGVFKILDADDNPIASVGTKEEADEIIEILGEGYKVQQWESVGAAVNKEITYPIKTDTPDFYSNLVNAINKITIPKNGMDREQFYNTVINSPGVKKSELEDMGFSEFVMGAKTLGNNEARFTKDFDINKKITKEEIDEFIERKSLTNRISTTTLETETDVMTRKMEKINYALPESEVTEGVLKNVTTLREAAEVVLNDPKLSKELEAAYNQYVSDMGIDAPLIFGDVDWMKGEYNGVLQELLVNKGIKAKAPIKPVFNQPDKVLPGGKNYKEIIIHSNGTAQIYTSDHFRRAGYNIVPQGENVLAHIRMNDRVIDGKKVLFIEEIQSDLHQTGRREGYNIPASKFEENIVTTDSKKVPNAPLKSNWHEVAMKKAIKHAIDNGYDAIAWTPGIVQNKRYSLATYINDLNVKVNMDGSLNLTGKVKDGQNLNTNIGMDELEANVGKEMADKIKADLPGITLSNADKTKINNLTNKRNELQIKISNLADTGDVGMNANKKNYLRATRNLYFKNEAPGLKVYYSYQTPVAYEIGGEMVMRVNDWSSTTNKHMSWIGGVARDDRIPGWRFEEKLAEVLDVNVKPNKSNKKQYDKLMKEKKAIIEELQKLNDRGTKTYTGKELEIGGTGMKGFYDEMLTKFLKKFSKKYNAQLEYKDLINKIETKELTNINKKISLLEKEIKEVKNNKFKHGELKSKYFELIEERDRLTEGSIKVPYMVIPESMKLDISQKGVPIAKVKQNKEMTATSMV